MQFEIRRVHRLFVKKFPSHPIGEKIPIIKHIPIFELALNELLSRSDLNHVWYEIHIVSPHEYSTTSETVYRPVLVLIDYRWQDPRTGHFVADPARVESMG